MQRQPEQKRLQNLHQLNHQMSHQHQQLPKLLLPANDFHQYRFHKFWLPDAVL